MIVQVIPSAFQNLALIEASTRGESGISNTVGAWICERVEGWYQKNVNLETESLAFTDGDVVVRSSAGGRDIKIAISKEQGISNDNEPMTAAVRNGIGLNHTTPYVLRVSYTDADKWRTAGSIEEVHNAWFTGAETEVIGKHIRTELTFRTMDSVITYS